MRKKMSLSIMGLIVMSVCGVNAFDWGSGVKGSGVEKSESRELAGFTELVLDISADVTVRMGDETKCTVNGDDNLLPLILTEIDDNTLRIYSKESFSTSSRMTVTVETPLLNKVLLRGSGTIRIDDLKSERLDLTINGSGDIITTGKVVELIATINGSGDILAGDLKAEKASASINGSGDIHVHATSELRSEIRGSGDIIYAGQPDKTHTSVHGSGEIKRK